MHYYKNLHYYRMSRNLTQQHIAQILGITQQQYALYELGKREIPVHKLILLSRFYGCTIDDLVISKEE